MTDLQTLVRQTSNPSILQMLQRLHGDVVVLGKQALKWRADCDALQLALETEREAANLYAKQVAHWIQKYDALLLRQTDEVAATQVAHRIGKYDALLLRQTDEVAYEDIKRLAGREK